MAVSRRSPVLRLVRETLDEAPEADAPPRRTKRPRGRVEDVLHGRVRTYASGSAPKSRRIKPPQDGDELADEATEAAGLDEADTLPVHQVQTLLEIYTRFMGPASKRVLDAELHKLGATPQTLHRERLAALVQNLARLIDTNERRRRFLAAMAKFPGAFG